MEPIPIEKLFPGASSITLNEGGSVNKEELIAQFTEEKRTSVESLSIVRDQIFRLRNEEKRLSEVHLKLEGCLHALSQLTEEEKPIQEVETLYENVQPVVPDESVQPVASHPYKKE